MNLRPALRSRTRWRSLRLLRAPLCRLPGIFALGFALAGCASFIGGSTCAIVLLVNGQPVTPTTQQMAEIVREVEPLLAAEHLRVVRSLGLAEMLATVDLVTRPGSGSEGEFIVRSIRPNPAYSVREAAPTPSRIYARSADAVEREQQRLMRSGSYQPSSPP